jgi:hypothetical protein
MATAEPFIEMAVPNPVLFAASLARSVAVGVLVVVQPPPGLTNR